MLHYLSENGTLIMSKHKGNTLNDDEVKILALLAVGTTEEKIAEQLCISTQAVRMEIDSILKKINAPNLFQAVLWAASSL
jgi:DNA-binding NarL/FixJ family response regulator